MPHVIFGRARCRLRRGRRKVEKGEVVAVKSPCIKVCKFDGKTGLCIGCLRTLEETRGWKKMSDDRCHQIIDERGMRETKLVRDKKTAKKTAKKTEKKTEKETEQSAEQAVKKEKKKEKKKDKKKDKKK